MFLFPVCYLLLLYFFFLFCGLFLMHHHTTQILDMHGLLKVSWWFSYFFLSLFLFLLFSKFVIAAVFNFHLFFPQWWMLYWPLITERLTVYLCMCVCCMFVYMCVIYKKRICCLWSSYKCLQRIRKWSQKIIFHLLLNNCSFWLSFSFIMLFFLVVAACLLNKFFVLSFYLSVYVCMCIFFTSRPYGFV